eukprot:4558145-Amphidinium_carterae.1
MVPHTDASDLLEQDVGLELLRREREKNPHIKGMLQEDYDELLKEVEANKCAIQSGVDGALERIVALVAIKVIDGDNRILVQVGKYDKAKKQIA